MTSQWQYFPLHSEVVFPKFTDAGGHVLPTHLSSGFHHGRSKRDSPSSAAAPPVVVFVSIGHRGNETMQLKLHRNRKLLSDHFRHRSLTGCHYTGRLKKERGRSTVAVDLCNGITGLIQTRSDAFFIQPLDSDSGSDAHLLYPVKSALRNRRSFSLADDQYVLDEEEPTTAMEVDRSSHDNVRPTNERTTSSKSKKAAKTITVTVAADTSVIQFHGNRIEQFLLILMNIVNAIYADPTLGAKLSVVVTNIALIEDEQDGKVSKNSSRASLSSVCNWFKDMNHRRQPSDRHDLGVYLTRLDIGGPAGFAPVGGICNYRRSCALVRDEGLTTSFIIAHEMGHILGFSHDGDKAEGNTCSQDAEEGSVMAPLVLATFTRFHWSSCTKREHAAKLNKWFCLNDDPSSSLMKSVFQSPLGRVYSLDEQCRMEFGDGFQLCRSFVLSDPCLHLWCSNKTAPLLCKTKKGPPLEGTPCGKGKWCAQGFCQPINRKKKLWDPVQHNPQHGGWGAWSAFGDCSRSCGGGVRFRTRRCDNPPPLHGGEKCVGSREEFAICQSKPCPVVSDFRAEQCLNLPQLVGMEPRRARLNWVPYPTMTESMRCKLTCVAQKTNEVYQYNENVIDGTLCSYDVPHHICIQGQCQVLGCDKILGSNKTEDACGICAGNGGSCKTVQKVYVRTPKKANKVAIIPRGARHVEVKEVSKTPNYLVLHSRHSGASVLNRNEMSASRTFVWVGTKFVYTRSNDSETVTARGPVLDEVIVMLVPVAAGLRTMITVNYTVAAKRRSGHHHPNLPRHELHTWKVVGWSRCSRSCGGGEQYTKLSCWDRRTDSAVGKRLCRAQEKPTMKRRVCNTFACTYRWRAGEWEHCTHTCGSNGTQMRPVHCVPINETKTVVPPNLCQDGKPEESRSCNRIPCASLWFIDEWSPCSATCGHGVQVRNVTCIPPENEVLYDCGEKPEHIQECYSTSMCPEMDCKEDASEFCTLQELHRYCQIPSYRTLCCRECSNVLRSVPPNSRRS